MQKLIIVFLVVCIFVLCSFLYKNKNAYVFDDFPVEELPQTDVEAPLYINIFFSRDNCHDCLTVIDVLNSLPEGFRVTGLVPGRELDDEALLRSISGARFQLRSAAKFIKYRPHYSPTILGVSRKGKVYFSIPSVPGTKENIRDFFNKAYYRLYPLLIDGKK